MDKHLFRWALVGVMTAGTGCGGDDGATGAMTAWASPQGPAMPQSQAPQAPEAPSPGSMADGPSGPGSTMASSPGQVPPTTSLDAGATPPSAATDAGGDAASPDPGACDRSCLLAIMQGYIDALLAQDPSQLEVSADLKYTENGVPSELGQTVWQSATSLVPDARLDFADPQEGQVASQFVFEEAGGTPVIYQVRLKVEAGEITEIETMAVRRAGAANGFFNVANMEPEPVFLQELAPDERESRETLVEITDMYLDYLEGKRTGQEVPFGEGCKRYENGQATASGVDAFNLQSFWRFNVTRRILIVDEEAGITWGMFPFEQTETALVVGEAFKIFDGEIQMIQAVMANQPAKVWD